MIDYAVGAQFVNGDFRIAETDNDDRHLGRPRGLHVGLAVADQDRAVATTAKPFDHVGEMPRIGLAIGLAVSPRRFPSKFDFSAVVTLRSQKDEHGNNPKAGRPLASNGPPKGA